MHTKTVAKYIRRSPYQSVAAILIMSLTFLTISIFSIITLTSIRVIDYFESRPQLSIFFRDEASREDIESVRGQLESTGKVQEIRFVSKEEALSIYKEQNKDDPLLLDLVTADILPASLDVQAIQANDLVELASIAQQSDLVDEVVFQEDIVDTLVKWTNAVRAVGIGVIAVLVMVSIFVILTIIGIKITVRKDEIEIMKLIGATNWFIRTPFLLEGMLYGAVGALVGMGISFGVLYFVALPQIQTFVNGASVLPFEPLTLALLFSGIFISAIFLGALSSFLAVLRYLK